MVLDKVPIVVLVFFASFLAAPLIYSLDKLAAMENPLWVFMSGVITLPLFGMLSAAFVRNSPGKEEPLFYVWSIFSFTAVVDLFIALELDGYVKGFMEFYLREGEPYLRSSYGTMINWWDGTGHFAMYLTMIALLCAGKDYRIVGLYWVGSIMNSMIVFMPGNVTGNKGIRWSYLLNVPYVYYPIYAGVRFIRNGMTVKHKQPGKKQPWEVAADWIFGTWFVGAMALAAFRMASCMGCKDKITQFYLHDIEPYLDDPFQYGRTQALCYFYYFVPFYAAAVVSLIYPGQHWLKDWSVVHAGASMQAQLVYIASSLKWRTDPAYIVPDTIVARSVFWTVNLSLLIMPHLFAMYCNRVEFFGFFRKQVMPRLRNMQGDIKTSQQTEQTIGVNRRTGPVTRQQKKLL